MVTGIAHICIRVADLERTRRFYCEGLGLKKVFDFKRDGKVLGFYLGAGPSNYLEFFEEKVAPVQESPIAHLCLEVDSIDATNAKMAAAGYQVGEKILGADHSYQAWLTDPDGIRIELHEYTADSCQKSGKDCIV